MGFNNWCRRAEAAVAACRAKGGLGDELSLKPPATLSDVERIERAIDLRIPDSFRRIVTECASAFSVYWHLDEVDPPGQLSEIFCGSFSWDLWKLPDLEQGRRDWITEVFPNPDDDYDRVWHDKLAVHEVGNGDIVALDLSLPDDAPLVYLSHDGGEGHGQVIGESFEAGVEAWSKLGFPGSEDWQWLPFTSSPASGIDPDGELARRWRKWFGLAV